MRQLIFLLSILWICSGASLQAWAQISFMNATNRLPYTGFIGVWSKGVADIDGNGLDDVVMTRFPSATLYITWQLQPGVFRTDSIKTLSRLSLSTTIGDINNDNRNDIITGSNQDGLTIQYNTGSRSFRSDTVSRPLVLMQAANLVDVNNDGWLDYFACNDIGLNQLWKNDRSGKLTAATGWIDFRTVPLSDNSGNYGSVWSDIDNDGDLDLYIAKCSEFAMADPADPRRINQLFINNTYRKVGTQIVKNETEFTTNPAGWFTEAAATYNVKISGQSWSADFADIDNDGDQDLLVTNHELPTMLLENDGTGHFQDITTLSGLTGLGKPLQGILRDFDNDGYVDVLVSGDTELQLWLNNGNKTFRKLANAFGKQITNSFAVGDLNHDGFYDVYCSYNPNNNIPDSLWLNSGNRNHFLSLTLMGSQSNKNGIGAKITVHDFSGHIQVREVRAGESYGITNSYAQIIGLGEKTSIQKVTVRWPSGITDTYNMPPVDQHIYLKEGGCLVNEPTGNCSMCTCPVVTAKRIR